MANISIRNLDNGIKQALQRQAAAAGCSLEEFLRRCLGNAVFNKQNRVLDKGHLPDAENETAETNMDLPFDFLPSDALKNKRIVLVIGGSVAAYKALELIRRLRRAGAMLKVIMTAAAQHFITPLAVGALIGDDVYTDLFSRQQERDIGHIRLARYADIVLVAGATASRLAKIAAGQADDLAGAVLLATRAPVALAPAMNPAMWESPATKRNVALLQKDGCLFIGPEYGEMAENNEAGLGRMSEPAAIITALTELADSLPIKASSEHSLSRPLANRHIIVTSGPTYEPLDPVRYLANHSSGKQGHSLAMALARLGARVTLISGPVQLPDPKGINVIHVTTALQMLAAVEAALPADAAIFVAAVADWRPRHVAKDKIKKAKTEKAVPMKLSLVENPDILAHISHGRQRPRLVVGFAAETADLLENAKVKLAQKGADWIIANNVGQQVGKGSVMGSDKNHICILSSRGIEQWTEMPKAEISAKLAMRIAEFFAD